MRATTTTAGGPVTGAGSRCLDGLKRRRHSHKPWTKFRGLVTYTYDEDYRILSDTHNGHWADSAGSFGATDHTYTYEPSGRLASYTNFGSKQTITWDHDGNRLTYGTASYTYNPDDTLATSQASSTAAPRTYSYDVYGRQTADGCTTSSYDGFDRLAKTTVDAFTDSSCPETSSTSSDTITYTYDGLDRQTSRSETITPLTGTGTTTAGTYYYDGLSRTLATETRSTDTNALTYTLTADGQPDSVTGSTTASTEYLLTDAQGNIVDTTDNTGGATSIKCIQRFDPFGTTVTDTSTQPHTGCSNGTTIADIGYHATRNDTTTGNYQFGSRTYDPSQDAFTTPDSYRDAPSTDDLGVHTDPLTENTYTYVNGDPVNGSDPDGHCTPSPTLICPTSSPAQMREADRSTDCNATCRVEAAKMAAAAQQAANARRNARFNQLANAIYGTQTGASTTSPGEKVAVLGAAYSEYLYCLRHPNETLVSGGLSAGRACAMGAPTYDLIYQYLQNGGSRRALASSVVEGLHYCKVSNTCQVHLSDLVAALPAVASILLPGGEAAAPEGAELGSTLDAALGIADDVTSVSDAEASAQAFLNNAAEDGMAGVRAAGRSGEDLAGIVKNTDRIPSASGTAAYRIPDELNATTLGEVKNVSSLSYTNQLRDFAAYAEDNGLQFNLYVRGSTTFSGPLQTAIDDGLIDVFPILP